MNDIMPHVHDFAPRLQFLKFTDESFRPARERFKLSEESFYQAGKISKYIGGYFSDSMSRNCQYILLLYSLFDIHHSLLL